MEKKSMPPPLLVPIQTRQQSRRKSLQGPSTLVNQAQIAPASPEVISSLITSLSAISTPTTRRLEDAIGSHSSPASPSALQTTFGLSSKARISRGSFGIDYGAFDRPSLRESDQIEESLDELAASAPVIRTAKPPSGFSSLTAPKSPSSRDSSPLKTFLRGPSRPGSKGSLTSKDDASSIGTLSIEPSAPPTQDLRRKSSSDSWGKKQARNQRGLMYMSSKERLREKEMERKRTSVTAGSTAKDVGLEHLFASKFDSDYFMAETAIKEEPPTSSDGKLPRLQTSMPTNGSPVIESGVSPSLSAAGFPSEGIPQRDSSLRKPAASSKKRSSQRSSRHSGRQRNSQDVDDIIQEIDEQQGRKHDKVLTAPRDMANPEALNLLEPLTNLEMPLRFQGMALTSKQVAEDAKMSDSKMPYDAGEGAPSPAVAQRKVRLSHDGGARAPQSQKRRSATPTPEPHETPQLKRTNSKLKRLSAPLSPRSSESHHRSSSNTITRVGSPELSKPQFIHIDDRPTSADSIDDAVEAYLCSPRLSQKIRHPQTGRIISFSEVGDSEGFAVFCCVGMGLTRYITAFYDELALTLKLRLITPDRPGVGDSEPYNDGTATPLSWPDDVYAICQALKITKFSILAHSAGAIYALATALRMPQHIRGRIHLLAPWIPPSQMNVFGSQVALPPTNSLPTSQRILRALPTPILKAANSSFMSATSSSITSSLPKQKKTKRKSTPSTGRTTVTPGLDKENHGRNSAVFPEPSESPLERAAKDPTDTNSEAAILAAAASTLANRERQIIYDSRLTHAIWDLATSNANPAVDLLVCLERRHTIGFRYVDIVRPVVIHHGSKDTRVPVDNVRWLGKTMKRCEVRVLEGEGHGLMASAAVMGGILMEIAKEWEDWTKVTGSVGKHESGRRILRERASVGAFR